MSQCRDLEPLFTSYVDGESSVPDRARVESHLALCPPCREHLDAQRVAREALHTRRERIRTCATDALKARCRAQAQTASAPRAVTPMPVRRAPAYRRWMPLTAAATILLAVAAVFGLGLTDKASALAFQTTLDHVKCARFHMPAGEGDPVAAAEAWHARFGWPIRIPASVNEPPLQLRGVRRCGVLDGRVAHVMYSWDGKPLSLYVLPTAVLDESPEFKHQFGRDAVMWSQDDRTYMVISDRPRGPALERVVAYIRTNVR